MHSKKEYANGIVHINNYECTRRKQSVPIIDKEVYRNKQYNLHVYYIPKHFSLFITIEKQRQERRGKIHGDPLLSVAKNSEIRAIIVYH